MKEGWIHRKIYGWMHGYIDAWIHGWMDEQTDDRFEGRMDAWLDAWMNGCMAPNELQMQTHILENLKLFFPSVV